MAKNLLDLKKTIAAFTRRSLESFSDDNGDSLLVAINHAKDFAQRGVDFERAFVQAQVTMGEPRLGGDLTTAKRYPDGQISVDLKTVRKAFLRTTSNSYELPVPIVSRQSYVDRLERQTVQLGSYPSDSEVSADVALRKPEVVLQGQRFFVQPALTSPTTVYFDAIEWMEDFDNDEQTHFLFTYCFDFMMFRSIFELNFLLKEDQRFNVSMTVLENTWSSVRDWNAKHIGNAVDNISLD